MTYVDGNAIIGALSLATGTDVSLAEIVCGACGRRHAIAEAHVYLRCPGTVVRCPSCTATEIVLVEINHHIQFTVTNVATIDFAKENSRVLDR